ncbi:MAG: signal peptidase II [Gammaproteobacteria bacterium]|nr:MAG: signal peptidase II [Gammaproteobacteria bacterium]
MNKIIWFLLAGLWILADQVSKHYAVVELKDKAQIIDVLPVLRWAYAENHGAAFGLLSDQGGWQKWFFLSIGAIATVLLTIAIIKADKGAFFAPFGYASILGGALGNVYDRAVLGYVRDMISVYYEPINFHFAIFNVADVAISVGVGALIIDALLTMKRDRAGQKASQQTDN